MIRQKSCCTSSIAKSTEKNDVSIMKPEVNYLHGSKDFTMFDGLGPVLVVSLHFSLYLYYQVYLS